jgi:hypothetical protein
MEAHEKSGVSESEVSHASRRGSLRYLAGDKMPGLVILDSNFKIFYSKNISLDRFKNPLKIINSLNHYCTCL